MLADNILATKLFIPPTRKEYVARPRLINQLNEGLNRRLTLISVPAGFGKTTLLSEWIEGLQSTPGKTRPQEYSIGWVSLDENDNDPKLFLTYLVAASKQEGGLTTVGDTALRMLQSPQPAPSEAILTSLINDLADISDDMIIVLDDFHLIEAQHIHNALAFLLENQPPQLHLV